MRDLSDAALVEECLSGHTRAFETLIDRYQKVLYNVALRMVKHTQDAEDLTQTIFIKVYENLNQYDPRYKFFSWVYKMTVNECLNYLNRPKRYSSLDTNYLSTDKNPDEVYAEHELTERVEIALMDLSPEDRALIVLKHFQGFTYKDIAFIFDISIKTVKSRLYTARQRLKDILLKYGFAANGG